MSEGFDVTPYERLGKVSWEVRAKKIREDFPTIQNLDWNKALERDIDLFGRVMRDILKLEQASPGRPGPRPSLDMAAATRRLNQLMGNDYTLLPFKEAFAVLANGRSHRHLASMTGLNRNTVQRLLKGDMEPDGFEMAVIAETFGKHPSYFAEWRHLFIIKAFIERLEWSPDTGIDIYRKLDQQYKNAKVG
jgi:transcriptional regulator with XRE-family HTH domain